MFTPFILWALASSAQAILVSPPTGPYAVSMSVQDLVDDSRLDPYAPTDSPHSRRVLISTFLPVNETKTPCIGQEKVAYMTPLVAQAYDELGDLVGLPNGMFSSLEMEFCRPRVRSCQRSRPEFPLVLFSPGWGNPRLLYGAMARELASRGFAVVTIDHPYDPSFVEFPDGAVYKAVESNPENTTELETLVQVRSEDASFVLTHLHENPIQGIKLDRTIMFGHSLGGATAAATMMTDSRILGGVNLDGRLFSPVLEAGLARPFALVGVPGHFDEDPTWNEFYAGLSGGGAVLSVAGTTHATFSDFPVLVSSLISSLNLTLPEESKSLLEAQLGTMGFERAGNVVAGIVEAFSELAYSKRVGPILAGGDTSFPEVSVVKSTF